MSRELSPANACRIADSAYGTFGSNTPAITAAGQLESAKDLFDVQNSRVFTGTTGPSVRTNFGYVAHGKSASRQGEAVVAVRGTDLGFAPDWLTNIHFSTARSATGWPAHAGFNQLANSILPQVEGALAGRNPSVIHVVGHSLGGAAATLIADKLRSIAAVKLYTFGAPRASYRTHVDYLAQRIGNENIFRAYHDTDPVPMLPIFPYCHAPSGSQGYLMRGSGAVVSFSAHSLKQYQTKCGDSWPSLPTIPHRRFSLDTIDDVLEMASGIPNGFLSAQLMRLIVQALGLVLSGIGGAAGLVLLGAVTVVDQIALAISMGVNALASGMEILQRLVAQIMRWLGIAVSGTVNITTGFLRWLLQKLFNTIAVMAASALRRIV